MARFDLLRFPVIATLILVVWISDVQAMTTAEIAEKWKSSVVFVRLLDERENEITIGSGFVIAPELVATCYHVVAGGVAAQVKTADRIIYPVTGVVASDRARDLAILRVNRLKDVVAVELGDSLAVKPGDAVVAMGSPLGLEGSISDGVVSGLRDLEKFGEVIQVSAPVSRGSSGGPLFDSEGRVIGVISFTIVGGQNVNFGIPANALKDLMARAQEAPTDASALKQDQEKLLTEIGILPPRKRTLEVRVPKNPPYTVALFPYHEYDPDSITASIDGKPLQRVSSEADLKSGEFAVTSLGVLKFDASARDKKLSVEVQYEPYRVALFVTGDTEDNDFQTILQERLRGLGDEVVSGAEVTAAVLQWQQREQQNVRDIGEILDCARLMVAQALWSETPYRPMSRLVRIDLTLSLYDLNTGREITKQGAWAYREVGALRNLRKARKRLAESCVDTILGKRRP